MDENTDIQNFCDINEVEELPHLQFIVDDDIILQHIGPLQEKELVGYLEKYFPAY